MFVLSSLPSAPGEQSNPPSPGWAFCLCHEPADLHFGSASACCAAMRL